MSTVNFPSDSMTRKEKEALNGTTVTFSMKNPCRMETLKSVGADIQCEYLTRISEKYHATTAQLSDMLGVEQQEAKAHFKEIGLSLKGFRMNDERKKVWEEFISTLPEKEVPTEPEPEPEAESPVEPIPEPEPAPETPADEPPMPAEIFGKDYAECEDCIHADRSDGICTTCTDLSKYDNGHSCLNCRWSNLPPDSETCQECFGGNWEAATANDEPPFDIDDEPSDTEPEIPAVENNEEISPDSAIIPFWNLKVKPVPTDFKLVFSSEGSAIDINMVARTLRMMLGNDPDGTLKIKWYKRRYL